MFLDETCLKTDMTTRYGRAMGGQRCIDHAPGRRWSTTTLLTAIREGELMKESTITCPGAMTGELFEAWTQQLLRPALRVGDIVVMDNLSCHVRSGVREAIAAAGASVWYLPPYSPDLNPIEQAFSKLKQAMRRAAARTEEAVLAAAVAAMQTITAADIRGYMAAAGYPVGKDA